MLNAIREMIVNGIVMQRVYSRASIFGRSSDHGSFIPILNSPRAKSDFQSRIQGKRRLIDHRKRSFTLFFISPSLSLSRERDFCHDDQKSTVHEGGGSLQRFDSPCSRGGRKKEGKKEGIHGRNQFTKRGLPLDLSRSNISPVLIRPTPRFDPM